MKKRLGIFTIALILIVVVLTGCSTTIAVRTLVPAKVDVSGYKTIAVMSTIDNTKWVRPVLWALYAPTKNVEDRYLRDVSLTTGLDITVATSISDSASAMIYKAINTGLSFKVLEPKLTDAYVLVGQNGGNLRQTLMDNGVDAILKTEVSYLYYDEYVYQENDKYASKDSSGNTYYKKNFYFVQQYAISISYVLTDVENNKIIATGVFSSDARENVTRIGHTKDPSGAFIRDTYTVKSASELFKSLINEFTNKFRDELAPHYVTEYFEFQPNKPKVDSLVPAYDALDDENWMVALRIFDDEYKKSGHANAGMNAAILYFATGEVQKAFDMTQEIYNKTGDKDALDLYYHFKRINDRENAAQNQINSTEKSGSTTGGDLIGF